MAKIAKISMYFDGASKGNHTGHPGPSGGAYWIQCDETSYGGYKFLGNQTNNVAEYSGLIFGLKNLVKYNERSISVYGDSKLVIEQMKGNWKVRAPNLLPLWNEAQTLIKDFKDITFIHIDRSLNSKADELANIAVNTRSYNTNVES
jgi:ribonuclease HI